MKTIQKSSAILLAILIIFSTMFSISAFAQENTAELADQNVVINYRGNYYDVLGGLNSLLSRDDAESVLTDLRALIDYSSNGSQISTGSYIHGTDSKHPSYSGTSKNSLAAWYEKSERLEDDTNRGFRLFYTNDYTTTSNWNREHVWPQSKSGGLYGKSGGGSDLHHIRPTYDRDNSKHGSFPYGNVTNGEPYYCNNDSDTYVIAYIGDENVMEVVDEYKGDIARIYAYMVTHYESLESRIETVMVGGYDTLVEWNNIDPVDDYEINRNNVAFDCQGNRNPYIDCPDLINVIWGDGEIGDIVYTDSDKTTDTSTQHDSDSSKDTDSAKESDSDKADYLTLEQANKVGANKNITLRGQVTYIYGSSTVILEEKDSAGEVHSFQLYDKNGVSGNKYPLNAVVEVKGITSVYNEVLQISSPISVATISKDNTPIGPIEMTIPTLRERLATYTVLKGVTLGDYDSTNMTMSDENGNTVNCYKPASFPRGVKAGDKVNLRCVPYVYNGEVQIRVANSSDYVLVSEDTEEDIHTGEKPEYDSSTDENVSSDASDDDSYLDSEEDTESDVDTQTDTDNSDKDNITVGDVNNDGDVNMKDVVIVQKHIAALLKISNSALKVADSNHDGKLTMIDVIFIQKVVAEII